MARKLFVQYFELGVLPDLHWIIFHHNVLYFGISSSILHPVSICIFDDAWYFNLQCIIRGTKEIFSLLDVVLKRCTLNFYKVSKRTNPEFKKKWNYSCYLLRNTNFSSFVWSNCVLLTSHLKTIELNQFILLTHSFWKYKLIFAKRTMLIRISENVQTLFLQRLDCLRWISWLKSRICQWRG